MSTRRGAWVSRARLAAVLGTPMPTNTVAPSAKARAAATVIISSAVHACSTARCRPPGSGTGQVSGEAVQVLGVVGGGTHVPVDPREERLALAADVVPG